MRCLLAVRRAWRLVSLPPPIWVRVGLAARPRLRGGRLGLTLFASAPRAAALAGGGVCRELCARTSPPRCSPLFLPHSLSLSLPRLGVVRLGEGVRTVYAPFLCAALVGVCTPAEHTESDCTHKSSIVFAFISGGKLCRDSRRWSAFADEPLAPAHSFTMCVPVRVCTQPDLPPTPREMRRRRCGQLEWATNHVSLREPRRTPSASLLDLDFFRVSTRPSITRCAWRFRTAPIYRAIGFVHQNTELCSWEQAHSGC